MPITRFARMRFPEGPGFVVDQGAGWHRLVGDPFSTWHAAEPVGERRDGWLPPVVPSKIIGIGRNYRDHAAERSKPVPLTPVVFLKPPSALVAGGDAVVLPAGVGRVDHEAELAAVIGRRATRVPRARAHEYVFGYTCVNDVTARDLQDKGFQFSHVKGYDSFAPLGPWIATGLDASAIAVEGIVNGTVRQSGNTRDLVFPLDVLVEYVSAIMTLEPGDVIATGTPAGIAPLAPGDVVTVRIEGIGELSNPVVSGQA